MITIGVFLWRNKLLYAGPPSQHPNTAIPSPPNKIKVNKETIQQRRGGLGTIWNPKRAVILFALVKMEIYNLYIVFSECLPSQQPGAPKNWVAPPDHPHLTDFLYTSAK